MLRTDCSCACSPPIKFAASAATTSIDASAARWSSVVDAEDGAAEGESDAEPARDASAMILHLTCKFAAAAAPNLAAWLLAQQQFTYSSAPSVRVSHHGSQLSSPYGSGSPYL